jgi:outer membrane lipoprotein-sorting protein
VLGLLLVLSPDPASAAKVDDIVNQANCSAYYQGRDGRAQVSMTIKEKRGATRKRELTVLRRDDSPSGCRTQKYYVYLRRPADLNKTVFLAWKRPGNDDERWLYLPALDVVKRIAPSDKRTSFVGSHFFYEDITGRDITADKHELEETTENYFVLKSLPKDPARVEFAYYRVWIHRGSHIPTKVEYYTKSDELYRVYEAQEVKTIQGHPTVVQSRMKDLRRGGETVLEFRNVKYDIGLPEDIFTERYLRQAPSKYLR